MDQHRQSGLALAIDHVNKAFYSTGRKTQALDEVSFEVRPGRVTGLIGPDGAGKTTLMRLAAGLLSPDRGKINVLGFDATQESLVVQQTIGYMPQRFGLYEDLSVEENLELYADLQNVPPASRPQRYQELMRLTGLAPFMGRLAGKLSGGMKQKLGLACTLVRAPRLLLLDEPTVGVDPVSRRELWHIVYHLVQTQGMSVLLSTAYLDEAERCDDVILLHRGRVLGQGTPQSFSELMQGRTYALHAATIKNRVLQALLQSTPGVIDAVIQGGRVRLVMEVGATPDPRQLLPGVEGVSFVEVRPRCEDCFIAKLRPQKNEDRATDSQISALQVGKGFDTGEVVIKVRELSRRFGDFYAVREVSFDVNKGEIFGLLGANGAGKTTTFRMLCGLLPVTSGSLSVAGLDLRHAAAAARARLGYMAQKFSLYGNLSVMQNLRFFSGSYGLSGRRRRERLEWALDEFELSSFRDVASIELPLGYKQRLAMACALMHEPEILFLDEPTSGVDPLARREFWHRINELAQSGVTVLVTTHFMEEAEYCDRLAIMASGEILLLGEPTVIKKQMSSLENPDPSLEDAFIALIEGQQRHTEAA